MNSLEWVTLTYGGFEYEICIAMGVEEIETVRAVDHQNDITAVMRDDVIDWMLEEAVKEIGLREGAPFFKDMSKRELEIDAEGLSFEGD